MNLTAEVFAVYVQQQMWRNMGTSGIRLIPGLGAVTGGSY